MADRTGTPATQRAGRYLPASTAHPAKMLPALAATAIAAYTRPGELVVDPMCGIGTTLVEAVHQGRHAIGVEYEPRWAKLARANLTLAASQGATGTGQVHTGDARHLLDLLDPALHGDGRAGPDLPALRPVGPRPSQRPTRPGIAKHDDSYSTDPANLARTPLPTLLEALKEILADSRQLLRPGGMVVLTARPWRRQGLLVDFPGQLSRAAEAAGLVPFERNVALLVGLRDDRLVPRPSFFQLNRVRKARARGLPATDHRPRGRPRLPPPPKASEFRETEGSSAGTQGCGGLIVAGRPLGSRRSHGVSFVRPFQELAGGGRVADRGRLVEVEDHGQVERVGAVVRASSSWRSMRSRSRVAGKPHRIRLAQGALTGPRPTAVLVLLGVLHAARPRQRQAEASDVYARWASSSRTGRANPSSRSSPNSTKLTPSGEADSTTLWLTSTWPASARAAIRAARFTVRPK